MDLSNFSNQLPTGKPSRGLLVFLLMALPLVLPAQQEWQWGQAFGGGFGAEDEVSDMVIDYEGNSYLVGSVGIGFQFADSIYQGQGEEDILLISFDCNGAYRWHKIMGTFNPDRITSFWRFWLAVDSNSVYLAGNVGIGTGTNYDLADTILSGPKANTVLIRYDRDGNMEWLRDIGASKVTARTFSYGLDVFEQELYLLLRSDSAEVMQGVTLSEGIHWVQFDANGVLQDQYQVAYSFHGDLVLSGIQVGDDGSVYFGGYGRDSFEIGGQSRPSGAFVAKFSPQGQLQWLEGSEPGTTTTSYAMSFEGMTVNGDNVYACGVFVNGVVLFGDTINNKSINAGSTFIVVDFANQSYKITDHAGSVSKLIDIEYNSKTSQLVTTGYITGTYIIDGDTIVGRSTYEPVVFFLNEELELEEFLHLETFGDYDAGEKVRIDPNGNVYLAGVFSGSLYFDNDTLYKQGGGSEDIFLAKYGVEECVDTSTGMQTPTLPTGAFGLLAYPNPATTHLTIKWQSETPGNHNLLLTDMQGRPVHRQVVSGQSGTFKLSTASVSTGLYYLHLQGADGRQAGQMIVIQR